MRGRAALGSMPTGRRDLENTADAGSRDAANKPSGDLRGNERSLKRFLNICRDNVMLYVMRNHGRYFVRWKPCQGFLEGGRAD